MSLDIDLADYDQVDEARYFMEQRGAVERQLAACEADLLTTLSSERANSTELANCENDFVFLPSPNLTKPDAGPTTAAVAAAAVQTITKQQQHRQQPVNIDKKPSGSSAAQSVAMITPEQLDIRSHRSALALDDTKALAGKAQATTGAAATAAAGKTVVGGTGNEMTNIVNHSAALKMMANLGAGTAASSSPAQQSRLAKPLTSISSNSTALNNPFYNLQPVVKPGGTPGNTTTNNNNNNTNTNGPLEMSGQAGQPFWMRSANRPIGLIEASTASGTNAGHLSDLMHKIITRSDSIFIAIPCLLCHDSKACPPSDISAWLSHMNRTHNCKLCPICSKLIGLGPTRDVEVMRKHVVSHIDDEWLEQRSAKTNFSFGLQHQWFTSSRCSVRDPRTMNVLKN